MAQDGSLIETPGNLNETLRTFMEANGVRGIAKGHAPTPSSPPFRDLYSCAWVRALLTKSDINDNDSKSEGAGLGDGQVCAVNHQSGESP